MIQENLFSVNLPVFSGPLDLLLHLVQKEQVSIWDVSLAKITEEYLMYLNTLQELNLEVTCDFLVLAATLVQIKARSLLPKSPQGFEEEGEDEREALIKRLLEYKKFKLAAAEFVSKAAEEAEVFSKGYSDPCLLRNEPPEVSVENEVSVWDLVDLIQELFLSRAYELASKEKPQVPRRQVSLTETILKLRQRFQNGFQCSFKQLLKEVTTKPELIVTFLASLELIRLGVVALIRDENLEIYLVAKG